LSEYIALNTTEPADTIKCEFELVDGTSLLEHSEGAAVQTETGTLYVFKARHLQRGNADSSSIAEPEGHPSIRVHFEAGVMEIHSLNNTLNAIHDLGVNGDEMVKLVDEDFCTSASPLELSLVAAGGNGCEDVSSLVTSMFIEKATLEVPADLNAPRVMVDTRASSITQGEGRDENKARAAIAAKDGEETGANTDATGANTGATGADTGADITSGANTGVTEGDEVDEAEGDEDDEEQATTTLPGSPDNPLTTTVEVLDVDKTFNVNRINAGAPRCASLGFILQTMLAGFSIIQAASMA
jgi:hypothetical protein